MDPDKPVPIKKSKINLYVIWGINCLLILAFLILVPTKTVAENIEVSYLDNETYYVQEAYNVQEAYSDLESYQVNESYTAPVTDTIYKYPTSGKYLICGPDQNKCWCSDYDVDTTQPEPFDLENYCLRCTCLYYHLGTDYHTFTTYSPVTKYRTVTKYQDVPKVRGVTKTKIEQRPLEVNWILGYKTPYTLHLPFIS